MDPELPESDDRICRHQPSEEAWVPPNLEDSSIEDIQRHIDEHIGPVDMVYHEIASDLVHIDIHEVAPTDDRPYWTLVTSGMSDLPMTTPDGAEQFRHAELMLCLPRTWAMDQNDWSDEKNYWPIRWLKICARFPHEYRTWFCWGHTLPNGDPPQAYAEGTRFCCMMLGTPRTVLEEFWTLEIRPDKVIRFFALYPLYPGEVELKLKKGAEYIEQGFDRNGTTEILDVNRTDLSTRPFWKVW